MSRKRKKSRKRVGSSRKRYAKNRRRVGAIQTIGRNKKRGVRRRKHRVSGIGLMPTSGIGNIFMKLALTAGGVVLGNVIYNSLIPKWWPSHSSPKDTWAVTILGLAGMYFDRKDQQEVFYISLGVASFGITELAVDNIPGLSGVTNADISGIRKRLMGLTQQSRAGNSMGAIRVGATSRVQVGRINIGNGGAMSYGRNSQAI